MNLDPRLFNRKKRKGKLVNPKGVSYYHKLKLKIHYTEDILVKNTQNRTSVDV